MGGTPGGTLCNRSRPFCNARFRRGGSPCHLLRRTRHRYLSGQPAEPELTAPMMSTTNTSVSVPLIPACDWPALP